MVAMWLTHLSCRRKKESLLHFKKAKSSIQPRVRRKSTLALSALSKAAVMAGIISILAYVVIPLPLSPVPVTMQSLGVMLAGLLLGPALGTWAVFYYLTLGFLGLPVFAGGRSGMGAFLSPSGGYLIGFLPGTWVTGMLSLKETKYSQGCGKNHLFPVYLASSILGGIVIVHVLGVFHLARTTGRPFFDAMLIGTVPFLPGDILKAFVASILARKIKSALKHLRA